MRGVVDGVGGGRSLVGSLAAAAALPRVYSDTNCQRNPTSNKKEGDDNVAGSEAKQHTTAKYPVDTNEGTDANGTKSTDDGKYADALAKTFPHEAVCGN